MNEEIDDDDDFEGYIDSIMPFLRIYISAGRENHDLLEVEEILGFLTSENRSINDTVKHLIDQGMVNVYVSSFNKTMKVF
jgi:hypothetical protein